MKLDEYTIKALNTYKSSTRSVYKYYITRIINKYNKDIEHITVNDIREFSQSYSHPDIVFKIVISLIKKRKYIKKEDNNER